MRVAYEHLVPFVPRLRNGGLRTLLNAGSGASTTRRLPECFREGPWREIRLDIDPAVKPDLLASVTSMKAVGNASVDAVWSSHNLEHLESHEVRIALKEIYRVLKPGGFTLITLPDLAAICKLILEGKARTTIYTSPAGPITPLDMLFGHRASIARGNGYMAHRTGFTADDLLAHLIDAGFKDVRVTRGNAYDLWAVAVRSDQEPIQRQPHD
jgi:Uncharacterized protein conserved in bacteria